jgi:hypothetical protein
MAFPKKGDGKYSAQRNHQFLDKDGLSKLLGDLPTFMREALKAERKPIHKNQRRFKP